MKTRNVRQGNQNTLHERGTRIASPARGASKENLSSRLFALALASAMCLACASSNASSADTGAACAYCADSDGVLCCAASERQAACDALPSTRALTAWSCGIIVASFDPNAPPKRTIDGATCVPAAFGSDVPSTWCCAR